MSVMFGMTWAKGLTLVLHTPGGVTNAAETLVAYLRSKFTDIEVIVPTYAVSAGTMISLAANRIVMGRQSQLGPIDPQFVVGHRAQSAQAVVDQFEEAKKEILAERCDGIRLVSGSSNNRTSPVAGIEERTRVQRASGFRLATALHVRGKTQQRRACAGSSRSLQ
jgi:hypothetical protein